MLRGDPPEPRIVREEPPRRASWNRGRILVASFDVAGAVLSCAVSWLVWTRLLDREFFWWHLVLLAILGTAWAASLAGSRILNGHISRSLLDDLPLILSRVLIIAFVIRIGIAVVNLNPDRGGLALVAAALGAVILTTTRGLAYALLARLRSNNTSQRVLIIGAGSVGARVAHLLSESDQPDVEVVGFLDKEPLAHSLEDESGLPVLGSSYDLEHVIQEHGVNKVIIAFSTAPHDRILEMVWECDRHRVDVSIVPRFFEAITVQSTVENLAGIPFMHLHRARLVGYNLLLKRGFDILATVTGLLVIWPVLLVVALAIKLDSRGPLIFPQERVGFDGKEFILYKFRSMRDDAESVSTWTRPQDPRRTRVGRVIRPLNLDELPQLFNVLRGDMSLVGPRPEQPTYAELFEEEIYRYTHRYRVKSGITGWAQVNGFRGDTSIKDRVLYDNYYIENWSFWLDIKIILMTLFKSGISQAERGESQTAGSESEQDVARIEDSKDR